jgi:hypothetical protein
MSKNKEESFLICPKCTCVLDIDCFPKCLICNTLKQCINCTSNDQIMAIDYLVLVLCHECIASFKDDQLDTIIKQFSVKKTELTKRIMKLKKKCLHNKFKHNITYVEPDLDSYIIKLNNCR